MRIYISGAITGRTYYEYLREFREAEATLQRYKQQTINPARIGYIVPADFTHEEYMKICIPLLETCDGIYMLNSWVDSKGAQAELKRAMELDLEVMGHAVVIDSVPTYTVNSILSIMNPPRQMESRSQIRVGEYAMVNTDDGRFQINTAVKVIGIINPETDPNNILVENADGGTIAWYREEDLMITREEQE